MRPERKPTAARPRSKSLAREPHNGYVNCGAWATLRERIGQGAGSMRRDPVASKVKRAQPGAAERKSRHPALEGVLRSPPSLETHA